MKKVQIILFLIVALPFIMQAEDADDMAESVVHHAHESADQMAQRHSQERKALEIEHQKAIDDAHKKLQEDRANASSEYDNNASLLMQNKDKNVREKKLTLESLSNKQTEDLSNADKAHQKAIADAKENFEKKITDLKKKHENQKKIFDMNKKFASKQMESDLTDSFKKTNDKKTTEKRVQFNEKQDVVNYDQDAVINHETDTEFKFREELAKRVVSLINDFKDDLSLNQNDQKQLASIFRKGFKGLNFNAFRTENVDINVIAENVLTELKENAGTLNNKNFENITKDNIKNAIDKANITKQHKEQINDFIEKLKIGSGITLLLAFFAGLTAAVIAQSH